MRSTALCRGRHRVLLGELPPPPVLMDALRAEQLSPATDAVERFFLFGDHGLFQLGAIAEVIARLQAGSPSQDRSRGKGHTARRASFSEQRKLRFAGFCQRSAPGGKALQNRSRRRCAARRLHDHPAERAPGGGARDIDPAKAHAREGDREASRITSRLLPSAGEGRCRRTGPWARTKGNAPRTFGIASARRIGNAPAAISETRENAFPSRPIVRPFMRVASAAMAQGEDQARRTAPYAKAEARKSSPSCVVSLTSNGMTHAGRPTAVMRHHSNDLCAMFDRRSRSGGDSVPPA